MCAADSKVLRQGVGASMVGKRVPAPRHFPHRVQCLQLFVRRLVGLACIA
jgi:hypothetical protein